MPEDVYSRKIDELRKNDYSDAYDIIERAVDQVRAYLSDSKVNLSLNEAKNIGRLATDLKKATSALEQRVRAELYTSSSQLSLPESE